MSAALVLKTTIFQTLFTKLKESATARSRDNFLLNVQELKHEFRHGLVVRIAGSHPAGPGSIPGAGK